MLARAVLGPEGALKADRLLVALELRRRGEQRPDLPVLQPHEAVAAGSVRLKGEPACRDAVFLRDARPGVDGPVRGLDRGKLRLQHPANSVLALHRLDVPGEADEIAPVTIVLKERERAVEVTGRERLPQICQDMADAALRRHIEHHCLRMVETLFVRSNTSSETTLAPPSHRRKRAP